MVDQQIKKTHTRRERENLDLPQDILFLRFPEFLVALCNAVAVILECRPSMLMSAYVLESDPKY